MSGKYKVTQEVVGVLLAALETCKKDELAAKLGISVSCLNQWLAGNAEALPRNFLAVVMNFWDELNAIRWTDPNPELTIEKFGKPMVELRSDFIAYKDSFWLNLKPSPKVSRRSSAVGMVCSECGGALGTKLSSKSGEVVVAVVPCQTCFSASAEMAEKMKKLGVQAYDISADLLALATSLRKVSVDASELATEVMGKKPDPKSESAGT